MWIKELNIGNFGRFCQRGFEFKPGINLIYGENESGKTTLHTFIKSCFYGMRRLRGRGAGKDDCSRYEPWYNPACYEGNIRFACGDKIFRLERDFGRMTAREQLVCETDGETLSVEDGDLDVMLGGVGEQIFENTVFIGQMKSRTDEGLAAELKNYMANYGGCGDGSIDIQRALRSLKNRKKEQEKLEQDRQNAIEELKEKRNVKIQYISEELEADKRELRQQQFNLNREERARQLHKEGKPYLTDNPYLTGNPHNARVPFLFILLVLPQMVAVFLGTAYLFRGLGQTKVLIITAVIGFVVCTINSVLWGDKMYAPKFKPEEHNAEAERLRWMIEHLQTEIWEKEIQLENLREEQGVPRHETAPEQKENIAALNMAMENIEQIVRQMQREAGANLKNKTSSVLSDITGGKYEKVQLDESFQPGVHTRERYIPIEQLSKGTMEQVYFALRMGAGEILAGEEPLPVILDDVFAMYDEERLGRTLRWLSEQKRQVLIFTCHRREGELMQKMGIPYYEVSMGPG